MAIRQSLEDQLDEVETSYRKLVDEIEDQLSDMEKRLNGALRDVQDQLPDDAAEMMQRIRDMNRSMRKRLASLTDQALDAAKDAIDTLVETSGRITGQPASKKKGTKGSKPAAKKPAAKKAKAKKTGTSKQSGRASQSWTKAELYAEATRLDIRGRSSMSKAQLVRAINKPT